MDKELKPCPFCGQEDDGSNDSGLFVIQDKNGARFVFCEVCEAKGPRIKCDDVTEAVDKAKAAWNMRK
jgi:Lar family restriction alleviation protein